MRILLMVILVTLLVGCWTNVAKNVYITEIITSSFKAQNNGYLSPFDSCVQVSYISTIDFSDTKFRETDVGISAMHVSCGHTGFSFTVTKTDKEITFCGLYDVYRLRYESATSDSMKLVQVDNNWLTQLISSESGLKAYGNVRGRIQRLVDLVYREEQAGELRFVLSALPKIESAADYLPMDTMTQLRDFVGQDYLIYLSEYAGVVAFRWRLLNDTIRVDEAIIPFRKYAFMNLDTPPDYADTCYGH